MKNDNKGFSLIELIVVIAIMAILVGVMAPNVMRYIEKAREGNDIQTLQTIHTAVYTALLDPDITDKPASTVTTYDLPTAASTDDTTFDGAVYLTLGKTASEIKFQSQKAGGNGKTGEDITINLGNNSSVSVQIGELGVNGDGKFTPSK